jgi:pimeloyl-ACP methyl ester carboxylesterase
MSVSTRALISATNGVFGDFLARTGNGLAIELGFRDDAGAPLALDREALRRSHPAARGDIAIWLHGLCCDETIWASGPPRARADDLPARIEREHGWTALKVRYNSGRHISENGEAFADALEALLAAWPVPVRRIALVGHSMGGLIARSAGHLALERRQRWPQLASHLICLGSPHHGAPLERFGHAATRLLSMVDITRPIATAINARSAGIKDLRHGALRHDDWNTHDPDLVDGDTRRPVQPLPNARHCSVGALLGYAPDAPVVRVLGDGLVPPESAAGRHGHRSLRVPFAPEDTVLLSGLHHLALVHDSRVHAALDRWLGR